MNRIVFFLSLVPVLLPGAGLAGSAAEKQPADDLIGPPFVTAKAWAIAHGRTGELLWSFNAEEPRKSASTTKIMCAYVVLRLADAHPEILEETITFSRLADSTVGSTAAIKAGESLSVRDCLYGLLLPSGNDAGNALAEHFNARFAPPDEELLCAGLDAANLATRVNFIAEMNRIAQELGLTRTVYRSSFGDGGTASDRTTSAGDLAKLAWHAMQQPLFREYVSTARHECLVRQPDGTPRRVVWEDTNKLLAISGYDGIKTGTTTTAGNCLVASGHRGRDHLLVVILGSDSDRGRYVDTQNLFRWAWLKLGHR
ncbi:MAG: serine hydrolase [Verrucomicrobiota bacterium]|nr:serine hydrolase [Verrucomicrobiota bacterium]